MPRNSFFRCTEDSGCSILTIPNTISSHLVISGVPMENDLLSFGVILAVLGLDCVFTHCSRADDTYYCFRIDRFLTRPSQRRSPKNIRNVPGQVSRSGYLSITPALSSISSQVIFEINFGGICTWVVQDSFPCFLCFPDCGFCLLTTVIRLCGLCCSMAQNN